ncbi:UNVERIFIED_CONTAM: hypothetical protein RMT77_013783 [Armadillidium vulgare]
MPVCNQELKLNLTSSCRENIKTIFKSKAKVVFHGVSLTPTISCLVCSQPLCNTNKASCKEESKLREFPIYNNILEFGFVKNFIPRETVVTIKVKQSCVLKLIITVHTNNPDAYHISFFECPNNKCLDNLEEHDIHLTAEKRCLHIGLMFLQERKVIKGR